MEIKNAKKKKQNFKLARLVCRVGGAIFATLGGALLIIMFPMLLYSPMDFAMSARYVLYSALYFILGGILYVVSYAFESLVEIIEELETTV